MMASLWVLLLLVLLPSAVVSFPLSQYTASQSLSGYRRTTTSTTTATTTTTTTTALQNALFTQVISDVDDTLKSSGGLNVAGVALGGIDVQYERGAMYPGVATFMLELSRHGLDTTKDPDLVPPKMAVLTARAEEFKAALEIKDSSKLAVALRQAGQRKGVDGWGIGPVLYGSVAGN